MASKTSSSVQVGGHRQALGRTSARLLALLLSVGALALAPSRADAAAANDKIDLRVLLLSAHGFEASLAAWQAVLTREGVAFDTIIANAAAPITADTLQKSPTHARYQAVVLATGGLLDCTIGCVTALSTDEWAALDAYQVRYGIRRVVAYAYPTPEYGLNWPFYAGEGAGTVGTLTAEGVKVFPYLKGQVPIDVGSWSYFAAPLATAAFTTLVQGPAAPDGTPSSWVGIHSRVDGIEELVVTFDTNPHQLHALLLSHGLLSWATSGIATSYNRNYFTAHIDDIFLPDDRWHMDHNTTYEDDGATIPTIRMLPADVDRALAWQAATGLVMDMVWNGAGSDEEIAKNGSDALLTKLLAHKASFRWINHTFSHPNLDFLTQAQIVDEIKKNRTWANGKGIPYHTAELVTGEHSGLKNPAMPAALTQAGIKWVAADNSREPVPYKVGAAITIPRHPANVYYNVGTFAEQLDEYNWIYFDNCVSTPTHTCLSTQATYESYVNSEASIMLRHLLTNDPRPHYFHQSNLAEDGTLYPVVDETLARYSAYFAVPLVQPLFRNSSSTLSRQAAWLANQAGDPALRASVSLLNGKIVITSPVTVVVPLQGYKSGALYGGEKSGWISVSAGTTKSIAVEETLTCANPVQWEAWQTTLATYYANMQAATTPTLVAYWASRITTLEAKIAAQTWTAYCP